MDPKTPPPLKRARPFHLGNVQDNNPVWPSQLGNVKQLLRVDFQNPMTEYGHVEELQSDQGTLVYHRKNRYLLAVVRRSFSPAPLQMLETFARIQHPNIADIIGIYFHEARLFIASEYLDMSLYDLEFSRLTPEEWEVASIIAEVILSALVLKLD
jgi:hypothetical protein